MLGQCAGDDKAVQVVESHKRLTTVITVSKTMFSHYMSEEGVIGLHSGIQIAYHEFIIETLLPLLPLPSTEKTVHADCRWNYSQGG